MRMPHKFVFLGGVCFIILAGSTPGTSRQASPQRTAAVQEQNTERMTRGDGHLRTEGYLSESIEFARNYKLGSLDRISGVCQTRDGGFVLAGYTDRTEKEAGFWILKLFPDGIIEWEKTYGAYAAATCVEQTSDGGYIVCGMETPSKDGYSKDFWVLRLTSTGDIIWQRLYAMGPRSLAGERIPYSVRETKEGGFIIAGEGLLDFRILKIYSNGEIEWQKRYGTSSGWEVAFCIQPTRDGGYIVAGTYGPWAEWDMWVVKLDGDGEIIWQKAYGGPGQDEALSIQETRDGGYILAGDTGSFSELGARNRKAWVIKLFATGEIEWQKIFEKGSSFLLASSILEDQNGGYIVFGQSFDYAFSEDAVAWVSRISSHGKIVWQKSYKNCSPFRHSRIRQTSDGGFIFTSNTPGMDTNEGISVYRISPTGEIPPSCGLVDSFEMTAVRTSIVPWETDVVPVDTNARITITNVFGVDSQSSQELQCWSLHQPPDRPSLVEEMNRSLFKKEYYNSVTWSPNSYNDRFVISGYRVYRKARSSSTYQLLAAVAGSALEHLDGPFLENEQFDYVISSVDAEGRESPRSSSVGN